MKTRIIIFGIVFGLIAAGALYVIFSRMSAENERAQEVMTEAETGRKLRTLVETERSRCENLISVQRGQFGDYEYCKKFVEWAGAALTANAE